MDLFQISVGEGKSFLGSYIALALNIAVNLAFYGALAFVIAYGVVKGIGYAQ